jgi:hypothetical protein
MSEILKLREDETYESEYIEEETGEYVKSENKKSEIWGFYLRFCGTWFYPCKQDQIKLKNLVINSRHLTIGNKEYQQPIELSMTFDFPDDGWKEVERHKATPQEIKRLSKV